MICPILVQVEESIRNIQEQKQINAKARRELDITASDLLDKEDKVNDFKNVRGLKCLMS